MSKDMKKAAAFQNGDVEKLFETFLGGKNVKDAIDAKLGDLPIGPKFKNIHTQNFELIVTKLLNNKAGKFSQKSGEYYIEIDGAEYNLSAVLQNLDCDTISFKADAAQNYMNFIATSSERKPAKPYGGGQPDNAWYDDKRKGGLADLNNAEMAAINIYTQNYYQQMNAMLRGVKHSDFDPAKPDFNRNMKEVLLHIAMTFSGLNRIPDTTINKVFRYENSSLPKHIIDERIKSENSPLDKPYVTLERGFVSTAADKPCSAFEGKYCTTFAGEIFGKRIDTLSVYPNEHEFLMNQTQVKWIYHNEYGDHCYFLAKPVHTLIGHQDAVVMPIKDDKMEKQNQLVDAWLKNLLNNISNYHKQILTVIEEQLSGKIPGDDYALNYRLKQSERAERIIKAISVVLANTGMTGVDKNDQIIPLLENIKTEIDADKMASSKSDLRNFIIAALNEAKLNVLDTAPAAKAMPIAAPVVPAINATALTMAEENALATTNLNALLGKIKTFYSDISASLQNTILMPEAAQPTPGYKAAAIKKQSLIRNVADVLVKKLSSIANNSSVEGKQKVKEVVKLFKNAQKEIEEGGYKFEGSTLGNIFDESKKNYEAEKAKLLAAKKATPDVKLAPVVSAIPVVKKEENYLQTDEAQKTIEYVYNDYLSKSFDPTLKIYCSADWEMWVPGQGSINRPNHGLAHTLRVASLVPVIAEYMKANNPKFASLTKADIQKAQYMMLFSVIGRGNEISFQDASELYSKGVTSEHLYEKFKTIAKQGFSKWVDVNKPAIFSKDELALWKEKLDTGKPGVSSPTGLLMAWAHDLDLMRCYGTDEFDTKKMQHLITALGGNKNAANDLASYARDLIVATGDRCMGYKEYKSRNPNLFYQCSTDYKECLKKINSVAKPELSSAPVMKFGLK